MEDEQTQALDPFAKRRELALSHRRDTERDLVDTLLRVIAERDWAYAELRHLRAPRTGWQTFGHAARWAFCVVGLGLGIGLIAYATMLAIDTSWP